MADRGFGRASLLKKISETKITDEEEEQQSVGIPTPSIGRGFGRANILEWGRQFQQEPTTAPRPLGRASLLRLPERHLAGASASASVAPSLTTVAPPPIKPAGRASLFKQLQSQSTAQFPAQGPLSADRRSLASSTSTEDSGSIHEPVIKTGDAGNPIRVYCNNIPLRIINDRQIEEYHVSFNPEVDHNKLRYDLLHACEHIIGNVKVFDGAKLYLPKRLSKALTNVTIKHPYTGEPQGVIIKLISRPKGDGKIHLFNVLFKRIMRILQYKLIGRKLFNPNNAIPVPQYKLQIWPGYVTAITEFEGGIMLQCDTSHKILNDVTALEVIRDCSRQVQTLITEAEKLLIGQVVMTHYNKKTYRIDEIRWKENPLQTFDQRGNQISFVDYYQKTYNIKIKDLAQPLLLHRGKPDRGSTTPKLLLLIPELSYLTGLSDRMKSDWNVMKSVAGFTRLTPAQRLFAYKKFLENIEESNEAQKLLLDWGLRLDKSIIQLDARILPGFKIEAGNGLQNLVSRNADWGRFITQTRVYVPVDCRHWSVIFYKLNTKQTYDLIQKLRQVTPLMGMDYQQPEMISLPNDGINSYVSAIQEIYNSRPNTQIIVKIMPTSRSDRYAAVKKKCYLELGMPSQVVNVKTISNAAKLQSIAQKIALQMNCKLGGELWAIRFPIKSLMILGMDVYHDASQRGKSVVGFVASLNDTYTRWYSKTVSQSTHQELADGLQSCMLAALKKYNDLNNYLPQKIILFRDGVGDGQFDFVLGHEVNQLDQSFHAIPNYKPELTVVIVQKRINARILARQNGDALNPPPGTVVDHSITRFSYYDFFLVSQFVSQATVTPTHYTIIRDDMNLGANSMQRITYGLTHMYYNWPGTIRVPAPCQYAHKLAQLTGQHLHREAEDRLSDRLFFL